MAMDIDYAAPLRAEPSRAEPSRAEPSRAEPSLTRVSGAGAPVSPLLLVALLLGTPRLFAPSPTQADTI